MDLDEGDVEAEVDLGGGLGEGLGVGCVSLWGWEWGMEERRTGADLRVVSILGSSSWLESSFLACHGGARRGRDRLGSGGRERGLL